VLVTPLRIVLVEDDALIGMLLEELLAGLGHTVLTIAVNEREAVSAASLLAPDLMIVDVNLADGDGISAMRAILAKRTVPHVFMTGDASIGVPAGAITLRKPFKERHLVAALERAAPRHRAGLEEAA